VAHLLKVADELAKLLALVGVPDSVVERSLSKANHLRGDTNPPLVEDLNGDLPVSCAARSEPTL
jgi:hypothetical protein